MKQKEFQIQLHNLTNKVCLSLVLPSGKQITSAPVPCVFKDDNVFLSQADLVTLSQSMTHHAVAKLTALNPLDADRFLLNALIDRGFQKGIAWEEFAEGIRTYGAKLGLTEREIELKLNTVKTLYTKREKINEQRNR